MSFSPQREARLNSFEQRLLLIQNNDHNKKELNKVLYELLPDKPQ